MDTVAVDQFLIGDYKNFVYLITAGSESFVVDPQVDLKPWQEALAKRGSVLRGVLLTHTHWDHVRGLPAVVAAYPEIPIYVHATDARRTSTTIEPARPQFRFVNDGERLALGKNFVEVLLTPGHSAGECSYLIGTNLFTGDTVFVEEVGRTDLETGSVDELFVSIQRIKALDKSTIIYPGHDYGPRPTSTVAAECENSAAFKCKTVKELDALP